MWSPINHSDQLPSEGTLEQAWLDFKAQPTNEAHERAKDVAAFANAMGGTLIVGAAEQNGTLVRYVPITTAQANQVVRDYHEAVRDRVRPAPIFETHTLDREGGKVVVVNVQPFPGQAVAVELKRPDETKLPDAFRFPVRVGTQTDFITPEQLPMFFDAKVRRIAIALEYIATHAPNVELYYPATGDDPPIPADAIIVEVNIQTNTLRLSHVYGSFNVHIPLDFVEGVCHGPLNGPPQLYLSGYIERVGDRVSFFRSTP